MKQYDVKNLFIATCGKLIGLSVLVGFVLRIVLLFNEQTDVTFPLVGWMEIFFLGLVNDVCVAVIACFFIGLNLIFWSEGKYKKPWGYLIWGALVLGFCYVKFFNTIFNEYGGGASKIVVGFLGFKVLSFGLRLFIPTLREKWRAVEYYLLVFIYVTAILLNAVSEYYFWNEFGVRYNFIAVDYLIYTTEVIGNIFESYPMLPLMTALFAVSAAVTWLLTRRTGKAFGKLPCFLTKLKLTAVYAVGVLISIGLLNYNLRFQESGNVYVNELQSNGVFRFYTAFVNNELDYAKFYRSLPREEAIADLNRLYRSIGGCNTYQIKDSLAEVHKNVVLITVESLSASYMARYGNTDGITPNLDRLAEESLVFDKVYAAGNRTVRGLEAVTLCIPPSPGQSVIKRSNNVNLFSTGKVLRDKGYSVQYFYGGNSYFDNMEAFFSGNGYDIVDKKSFAPEEITFSNIWGVCDEDMYRKALSVLEQNADSGKPFFAHIMTVSNHRPFTYPGGKIDIPEDSKSRKGGVKYTDYALGWFIEEARKQPWFENTVFVITADHCASSAGKTEIPLDKYHIPAMIYAPGFVQPGKMDLLVSQIDIMPTLFGLLHFSYESRFYGRNVFGPHYVPRALVATYQDLGYWEADVLTILSPVRRAEQFQVIEQAGEAVDLLPLKQEDTGKLKRAIINYQTVKDWLKKQVLPETEAPDKLTGE